MNLVKSSLERRLSITMLEYLMSYLGRLSSFSSLKICLIYWMSHIVQPSLVHSISISFNVLSFKYFSDIVLIEVWAIFKAI